MTVRFATCPMVANLIRRVPWENPVEAQLLRDVAFLLVLALLFVLTLQILWLTSGQRHDRERRRE